MREIDLPAVIVVLLLIAALTICACVFPNWMLTG